MRIRPGSMLTQAKKSVSFVRVKGNEPVPELPVEPDESENEGPDII